MGMRVTTGMSMNLYRYNLQNSTSNLANSQNTVLSHRKFNTFAENPSSATQAWRVRRAITNTGSYLKNTTDTYTRFNIAWAALGDVSHELTDLDGRSADIYAYNDPTASGRPALGQVLRQTAESVAQLMNSAKSGENFLFSGADELYAPFTWDNGKLLYRGVDVNAGGFMSPMDTDPVPDKWGEINAETGLPKNMPNKVDKNDYVTQAWVDYYRAKAAHPDDTTIEEPEFDPDPFDGEDTDDYGTPIRAYQIMNGTVTPADDNERIWAAYHVDQGEYKKLQMMSKEEVTLDLGMGLLEDDQGKLIDGTYYSRSLPGINMLGFGVDADGDPKNVCMIMMRLGEIYENCNPNTGSYDFDDESGTSEKARALQAEAGRLLNKLKAGQANVTEQYVEVNAKSSFLQQNEARLDLQKSYLNEQLVNLEDVDLADAITQFSWDYYCYSAALKVGTQLLSQSLIDYMS